MRNTMRWLVLAAGLWAGTALAQSVGDKEWLKLEKAIQRGDADMMVTGGSEATVTPMAIGGFANMQALSERNDSPETASRPFDATRDGFVMGEGAAVVILEELEHGASPGARVVIIDDVLSPGSEFDNGKLLDLQMLVILGGRERTADEWHALLAHEGFEATSIRRDPRWGGLIEGRAV